MNIYAIIRQKISFLSALMATNSSRERQGSFWPSWEENKLFTVLLAILLAYGIVFLLVKTREATLTANHVGIADRAPATISVTATDSATSVPDIATVDIGSTSLASTSAAALDTNTARMNAITAALKAMGIEDKDIKTTSYDVSPQYTYSPSQPSTISGYQAVQTITVRIRDQKNVSAVLDKARELGATNIGSLRFETDDTTSVEAEARTKAIRKAYAQGQSIARAMGAHLGDVVTYVEYTDDDKYPYPYPVNQAADSSAGSAPSISVGENETSMTVNIEFSLE
jgi:uncharacterized protein YggE